MNQSVLENKKAIVDEVVDLVNNSKSVVIAEYRGLKVSEIAAFKRELLKSNAKMSVYKNSLVERAVDKLGYDELNQYLEGPNAIITCPDPVSAAKVSAKFAKAHECFVIKGALVEGKVISKDEVITLSKLPNREGMLSMLLSVLQAPVRGLACAVKAVADKQ